MLTEQILPVREHWENSSQKEQGHSFLLPPSKSSALLRRETLLLPSGLPQEVSLRKADLVLVNSLPIET
jgi:hypothetical protein